jgi:hypothetical protein
VLVLWLLKQQRLQQASALESQKAILSTYKKLLSDAGDREERMANLLASRDAVTYQALTAVLPSSRYDDFDDFDPSDAGEISRIAERQKALDEEPLDEYEQSFATELGLDAEFFSAD